MQIEITKQSEKDFRFLLSRLSHEIRNPVTLINSELQVDGFLSPGTVQLQTMGQSYG